MQWALFNLDGLAFLLRWGHFIFGIAWIGMLWYFNFVQGPFFAETDAAVKNAATQKLVPRALWYFRWGAMGTVITGWLIIGIRMHQEFVINSSWGVTIFTGAIMGTLMWFNVWFVIWPRQKKIIAAANGEKVDNLPVLARRAFLASRTNTLLSVPLLFFMGAARNLTIQADFSKVGVWFGAILAILLLIEINALTADKGTTTKPIEKIKGVIISGLVLTAVFYVLLEVLIPRVSG